MRRWLPAVIFGLLAVTCSAVYYGETREEVLKELGKPSSILMRGGREVFLYPKGARIEFEAGKVAVVQGLEVTEGPVAEPAQTEAPTAEPAAGAAPASPETKAETPEPKAERDAGEQAEKELEAERTKQQAEFEKAIAQLENPQMRTEPAHSAWAELLVGLAVKALMMLVALKFTTKYWDFNIEWTGLAIAAGADTGVRAVMGVIGEIVMKLPSLFYADEAVAALVLVAVLRKVSHNKSLARAVTITMTVKVFSTVVGSMVAVAVMNGLFN